MSFEGHQGPLLNIHNSFLNKSVWNQDYIIELRCGSLYQPAGFNPNSNS